jgi:hypothetical protein
VKDDRGDLLAAPSTLNRSKNSYCQLLNVHSASDVRQVETDRTQSLVPDPSPSEEEIAVSKLKR